MDDLQEYNKGIVAPTKVDNIPKDILREALSRPPIEKIQGNIFVYYATYENLCYYILQRDRTEYVGYLYARHIIDKIWQVQEVNLRDASVGTGGALYHFIIRDGGTIDPKRLINHSQLSDNAEKLWLSTLEHKGLNLKIFDLKTKKTYDMTDIGNMTTDPIDNIEILHPTNDETYTKYGDLLGHKVRFFLLAEAKNKRLDPIHPIRVRHLIGDERHADLVEETIKTTNISTNVMFGTPLL